jgi:phage gpG-like protein
MLLERYPEKFRDALVNGLKQAMLFAEGEAKKNLTGGPRNVKTVSGYLRRSIKSTVDSSKLEGSIGSDVIYAAIHEYGGTITAKKGPYLVFQANGSWVKTSSVKIPERPYLRPALFGNVDKIGKIISKRVVDEVG